MKLQKIGFRFTLIHSFFVVALTLLLSTTFVQAQQEATRSMNALQTASPSATPSTYQLPYPGLLPDHPLWFVKAFRDRLMGILIADPLKKAEFDLLQADKRISAGGALIEKDKKELGLSTISKGENYFEDAVMRIEEAKRAGKDTAPLGDRLLSATKKHQEVLKEIEKTEGNGIGEGIRKELKRLEQFEKDVNEFK